MKKFLSIIAIAFILILSVIPSYAAEATTECEHGLVFNSEGETAVCPDCGKEVYECEVCEYIFCVENRECPVCKTKRHPMTNEEKAEDFIEQKKSEFYVEVGITVISFIGLVVITVLSVKEKSSDYLLFSFVPLTIIVLGLILAIKTYPLIAPFM